MYRALILAYGIAGYGTFLVTFLYLVGFVTGHVVPRSVDAGGPQAPWAVALLVDLGLVLLFGLQHSIMARPRFKSALERLVPPALERTTFVFATCAVLAALFLLWRPIPAVVWSTSGPAALAIEAIGFAGWAVVLLSTFALDHFDLFGLRQTVLAFRGRPYTCQPFRERFLYRCVRHPLMLGFGIAFWAAPTMTVGHLVFAASFTGYVLVALHFEERNLLALHGAAYRDYRTRVPKLLPLRLPVARTDAGEPLALDGRGTTRSR